MGERRDSTKAGSDSAKKKEEPPCFCPCCKKTVGKKEKALQCEICNEWSHIKCLDYLESEYQFLKDHQSVHWFCDQCNKSIASVIKEVSKQNHRQDKIEQDLGRLNIDYINRTTEVDKKLKELSDKVVGIDTKIDNIVEAKLVESLAKPSFASILAKEVEDSLAKPSFSSIVAKEVDDKLSKVSTDVTKVQLALDSAKKNVDEDKDRDSRASNIILYRVAEGATKDETVKNDKAFCSELCKEVLGIDVAEKDFKAIFRLGRAESGKTRPLLVQFREKTLKNQIMESMYKLKGADDKFKNISVTHDMTQKERDECKALVAEAKEKQTGESGEYIWRVRGLPGQLKLVKTKKH